MFYRLIFFIFIALSFFEQAVFAKLGTPKKTFTVEDSIKMVKIIDPNASYSSFFHPKVKMSPDGKYFIIVTRSGNLATGKNDYNLLLFQSNQVLAFLNQDDKTTSKSQAKLPEGKILAQISTSLNESAFQEIIWLEDNKTLAFIGWFNSEKGQTPGQVYRFDIRSRTMTKLTNHPRPIMSYAFNIASQKIVFISTVFRHNKDLNKPSYLVGVRYINYLTNPDYEFQVAEADQYQYYIQDIARPGHSQAVGRIYNGRMWRPLISLSPNGHRAIILTTRKTTPVHWQEGYNFLKHPLYKHILNSFDDNTMIPREGLIRQFSLIDLSTGNIRPIFDAPTGFGAGGYNIDARWMSNSNSVILANTSLPLDITDKKEKKRRSHMFSTIEYNVNTGHITPITNHSVKKSVRNPDTMVSSDGQFWALTMVSSGLLRIEEKNDLNEIPLVKLFKKKDSEWVRVPEIQVPTTKTDYNTRLDVSIHQDLNTPPEIMALDRSTGDKKIITDLNPQFKDLTFGKTEVLNWKDRNGRAWQGGLVYPPGFKKGQKYPLVIQTHGFDPHEFLIDGPNAVPSAFAAQALANKGMMVLQMIDPLKQDRNERAYTQSGFEAAIDHLSAMKLIDREKVGLIAWSSTGVLVQHMLLYSDYPIAAATIADSYNNSLGGYTAKFGLRAPGMARYEMINDGAVPWGENLKKWIVNDPTFHLDQLKTPLRLEQYTNPPSHWWDTYAILKRQHKPVEYYVFNDVAHTLVKPDHRMASQGGNVDWFAFWLKGEEDPDPAKVEQYKRWHKLRIQQEKIDNVVTQARKQAKDKKKN